jgi:hypothetical protein
VKRYYAAKETEMHEVALAGFSELVERGEQGATGPELFGRAFKGARWAYSMMRRLAQSGMVRASREERRGQFGNIATVYRSTPALAGVVLTGNVSSLVWAGNAAVPVMRVAEQEELPSPEATAPAEEAELEAPSEPASEDEDVDLQEALKALLKMTSALIEHAVSLGEDVATLRTEVSALKKSWE